MTLTKSGFSLVEMSIVLVIIGLLIGGTLAGQHMLRQTEITSAVKRIQEIRNAYNVFVERYNCIPGDCRNIRSFLPASVVQGSNVIANGDGNGQITCKSGGGAACIAPIEEHIVFMGTLQTAGLIQKGWDEPVGIGECKFMPFWEDTTLYDAPAANYLHVEENLTASPWHKDCMTGTDAQAIDSKIDDGKPATGFLLGRTNINTSQPFSECASATFNAGAQPNAVYNTTLDKVSCSLYLRLQ